MNNNVSQLVQNDPAVPATHPQTRPPSRAARHTLSGNQQKINMPATSGKERERSLRTTNAPALARQTHPAEGVCRGGARVQEKIAPTLRVDSRVGAESRRRPGSKSKVLRNYSAALRTLAQATTLCVQMHFKCEQDHASTQSR